MRMLRLADTRRISAAMRATSSCPQSGHGLVQQHDLRVQRQRHGDLQRALAAIGQQRGDGVGLVINPTAASSSSARALKRSHAAAAAPEAHAIAMLAHQRHAHVLQHGQARNTAEIWNERTMPSRAICSGASDVMSRPGSGSRPRPATGTGQQVETGGLAGAVGADQGMDGAFPQGQRHAVDGAKAASATSPRADSTFCSLMAASPCAPAAAVDRQHLVVTKAAPARPGTPPPARYRPARPSVRPAPPWTGRPELRIVLQPLREIGGTKPALQVTPLPPYSTASARAKAAMAPLAVA